MISSTEVRNVILERGCGATTTNVRASRGRTTGVTTRPGMGDSACRSRMRSVTGHLRERSFTARNIWGAGDGRMRAKAEHAMPAKVEMSLATDHAGAGGAGGAGGPESSSVIG
jgi:hypothetical protein